MYLHNTINVYDINVYTSATSTLSTNPPRDDKFEGIVRKVKKTCPFLYSNLISNKLNKGCNIQMLVLI